MPSKKSVWMQKNSSTDKKSTMWEEWLKNTNSEIPELNVEALGLSAVKDVKNIVEAEMMSLVKNFYSLDEPELPYYVTIRSPIFEISTKGRLDN